MSSNLCLKYLQNAKKAQIFICKMRKIYKYAMRHLKIIMNNEADSLHYHRDIIKINTIKQIVVARADNKQPKVFY